MVVYRQQAKSQATLTEAQLSQAPPALLSLTYSPQIPRGEMRESCQMRTSTCRVGTPRGLTEHMNQGREHLRTLSPSLFRQRGHMMWIDKRGGNLISQYIPSLKEKWVHSPIPQGNWAVCIS